jgi:hypothetical protein
MEYVVIKDRFSPDAWRVESVNYAGDGEVYVAIFSGPLSQERAEEYAQWKSAERAVATA